MKSRWNLLYAAIATALLLSACTTETGKGNPDDGTSGAKETIEEPEKNIVIEEEENTTEPEETKVPEPDKEKVDDKPTANPLTKEAIVTESDEQDYSISVRPTYKLTSEEPGRDSLFATENESVFMRIETMTIEESTYDYLVENMIAVLEASSNNTPIELKDSASTPIGEGIKNVKVLSVQAESGPVTGIIFERGDIIVRLTIFDSPKKEHFENFLRMGETIVKK